MHFFIPSNNTLPMPTDPSFDEFDEKIFSMEGQTTYQGPMARNGHVCDHLINSAIDETLARSIFDIVSAAKRHTSRPLERLTIYSGKEMFGAATRRYFDELSLVSKVLSNAWSISLNPIGRDDTKGQVTVTRGTYDYIDRDTAKLSHVLDPGVEAVFRKVWPRCDNDTGDWRKDWHSFPLSTA